MENKELQEQLLAAWVGVNGMLKDSRITRELTYNEAIVMKLVYDQYKKDGSGCTAVREIVRQTNMLKSLVNRTVNSLCTQGFLCKERGKADARSLYVRPVPERLPDFLAIHEESLQLAQNIIDIVGPEDAKSFIRMYHRLSASGLSL